MSGNGCITTAGGSVKKNEVGLSETTWITAISRLTKLFICYKFNVPLILASGPEITNFTREFDYHSPYQ